MHWIDWTIVAFAVGLVFYMGFKVQRYMKSTSDFLSAGRVAGRYLITVAQGEAGLGLIAVIGYFEMQYRSGWAIDFWGNIGVLVTLLMTLTGFLIYRYRESRVMTMAQMFEIRYSKSFRIFTGLLSFLSGILNFAIYPAVAARFFIYYCRLPDTVTLFSLELSTFGVLMAICLGGAVVIVLLGGQLTTMVTDCIQGVMSYFIYAALVITVLLFFSFGQFETVMLSRPQGESFLNPFDTENLQSFNILFVLIAIFGRVYNRMSWQGAQGYNCAAISPHEQKMGGVLGAWRSGFNTLMIMMLVLGAYTLMNHPDFAPQASAVQAELVERIDFGEGKEVVTQTIREQMRVPVALRQIFPVGLTGFFCALMFFLMISTDTTYLHSWGSIFIQDVVLPLRKKPFSQKTHILLLRLSIVGVAVFAWAFSFLYGQVDFILMFLAITGAIYMGGAGAVIIGGFYWKKGTNLGAWAAMLTGCSMGVGSIILQKMWGTHIYPFCMQNFPDLLLSFGNALESLGNSLPIVSWKMTPQRFPISSQELLFLTMISSIFMYVVISLITHKKDFNLEKMLHRGRYNLEHKPAANAVAPTKKKLNWSGLLGINSEYTKGDRIIAWSVLIWTLYGFVVFLTVLTINLIKPWSNEFWFKWWRYYTLPLTIFVASVTTVWFSCGALRDLRRLFVRLKTLKRDDNDDGRVVDGQNADEHFNEK